MYDVIVLGARAAGSPTAMLLARHGHRVLCVDRATFPSDTVSTHMITVEGSAQLRRWGLLPQVVASGCPAVTRIELDLDFDRYGHFVLEGFPDPVDGDFAAIYAPKRTILDKILVDAASAAGAEVREGFLVSDVLVEDGQVVGIRGRDASGSEVIEKARLVVGADGIRSKVAATAGAPEYYTAPAKAFGYYGYWAGVELRGLEFYTRPGATVIAFPTNDDHAAIFVERPERDFEDFKRDLVHQYVATVERVAPDLAARMADGQLAGQLKGAGKRPNFFRKPYGPGWALVGDAGAHKDPITAQGITDAFRDAELLSQAVHEALSGASTMEAALAEYEARRNSMLKPLYDFIVDHAEMQPFDDTFQDVLAALRGNQPAIDDFFGVIQNTVPWEEFFSPSNLSSILGLPAPSDELASVG